MREGAIGGGEGAAPGWRRAAHSPATPPYHLHGSRWRRVDLAGVQERAVGSIGVGGSRWGRMPSVERGKDGRRKRRDKFFFLIYRQARASVKGEKPSKTFVRSIRRPTGSIFVYILIREKCSRFMELFLFHVKRISISKEK